MAYNAVIVGIVQFVIGWYAASMSITFSNKWLLSDQGFDFPFTLAATTNFLVFLLSWLLTRPACWRPQPLTWRVRLTVVGPIGLLTALDIGCSNWALSALSVAFHTIVRGTVPAFVLCFSLLLGLDQPSWLIFASVSLVCIGVGLAAYGELEVQRHLGLLWRADCMRRARPKSGAYVRMCCRVPRHSAISSA